MHAVVGLAETLDLELKQASTALGATVPCLPGPGRLLLTHPSHPGCHTATGPGPVGDMPAPAVCIRYRSVRLSFCAGQVMILTQ
jgi:hypothetical protein